MGECLRINERVTREVTGETDVMSFLAQHHLAGQDEFLGDIRSYLEYCWQDIRNNSEPSCVVKANRIKIGLTDFPWADFENSSLGCLSFGLA